MTEASIIEIWAPEPLEGALLGYLRGLVDLGVARSLFVVRGDGGAARLDGGEELTWHPDIREALQHVRPESCQIVTVATLPVSDGGPMESSRELLFAGAYDEDITESLLMCPTFDSDLSEYTGAFELVDRSGRYWDRFLMLSPEDLRQAGDVALPVRSGQLVPLAGAMGALLAGAIDGSVSAKRLKPSPAGEVRVVRGFVNLLDVGAATTEAISEALDGEELEVFDDDHLASLVDNPLRSVTEAADSFIAEHRLTMEPYPRRAPAAVLGLLAALRGLVSMLRHGANWLPREFLNQGDVARFNDRRRAVAQLVTNETAGGLMLLIDGEKVTIEEPVDLFDDQLVSVRRALSRSGVRVADQWLPTATPASEPAVWRGLTDTALAMLDGFGHGDLTPVLAEPELSAPRPLTPETVVGLVEMVGTDWPQLAMLVERPWPAPFVSSDPIRLDLLIDEVRETLSGAPSQSGAASELAGPTAGSEDGLAAGVLEALEQTRVEADSSFTVRVGRAVAGGFQAGREEFLRVLEQLLKATEVTWDAKPERRARLWVWGSLLAAVLSLGSAGYGLVAGESAGWIGASVLGLLAVGGVVFAALRYQRAVNARERDLSERVDSEGALSHYWRQVRRFAALYMQFRDWSTILTADVHLPVGRRGNPVLYGGQQLRPQMLSGAVTIDFDPGVLARLRRALFQRGWRSRLHRHVVALFLDDFRERGGYRESPDPYIDVEDLVGVRRELVTTFIVPNGGPVTKRVELETQAERILTVDGTESVVEHIVGISLDGQRKNVEEVADFFDTSGEAPFARYALGRGFFRRQESPVEGRDNGVEFSYRSSLPFSEKAGGEHEFASERPAPDLVTVRVDTSFEVSLARPEDGEADAEPMMTLGEEDEEYYL